MNIEKLLLENQDKKYRDFQSALIPNIDGAAMIGVRTPVLRQLAKEISKSEEADGFLNSLPHGYFEENQLHAFIVSGIKDFDLCIKRVCDFLPYVDNWATCDQMSPKVFKKHKDELLGYIDLWLKSGETYTVRFGIKMLMDNFLGDGFKREYAESVCAVQSEEYYVNMMKAWYFATALAKNYDEVIGFIEDKKLDKWTHNKAIQKATESYRVTDEHKAYLKSLK